MALKAEKPLANVISLFGRQPEIEEEEVAVGVALRAPTVPRADLGATSGLVDLTGRPKVWLTIGRGKTGKTTLIRFLVEETMAAGRQALIADVDRTNATLSSYFENVQRPPEGDESSGAAWLEKLFTFVMAQNSVLTSIWAAATRCSGAWCPRCVIWSPC